MRLCQRCHRAATVCVGGGGGGGSLGGHQDYMRTYVRVCTLLVLGGGRGGVGFQLTCVEVF